MTVDEFQKKYHDYAVSDSTQAMVDAHNVNNILIDCKCVVVKISGQYCLMLDTAASLMKEIGVL